MVVNSELQKKEVGGLFPGTLGGEDTTNQADATGSEPFGLAVRR